MRKKLTCFVLALLLLLPLGSPAGVSAAANTELNIYALYLSSEEKGDSTLLESKGHYLLVDIGQACHSAVIIDQLQKLGVTHVDILFSHLHIDHSGGSKSDYQYGLRQLANAGITVDTLYLPSQSLAPLSRSYPTQYQVYQNFMSSQGTGKIVYLNVNDKISFGDVTGDVIGPLNTLQLSPQSYTKLSEKDQYVRYENNCSLAIIFTCGTTRYFTAGDCYGDEAGGLVARYGSSLKCDIMKLNHHGIGDGNSTALLAAIQPSYSFVPNTGVYEKDDDGEWRCRTAVSRASEYGLCYMLGNEEETLIYHIVNDQITLYSGSTITSGNKLTGWVSLYGADGFNRDHDMYYLDKNCTPVTGVKKIGDHYFYFRNGGQMDYGTYDTFGQYSGWHSYSGQLRYFQLSDDETYAYMSHGVSSVGGSTYYFDSSGFKVMPEEDNEDLLPTKVGSSYYSMDSDGALVLSSWEDIDDSLYYFGANGKMLMNTVAKVDGDYYIFESDGALVTGDGGNEFYDFKGKTYLVRKDGTLVTDKRVTIDGYKYCFNAKGVVQKDKIIRIGSKRYYFNKHGHMVTNKKIKVKGKVYYAAKNGALSTTKPKTK